MSSRLPKHLHDAIEAVRLAREFSAGVSFDSYAKSVLIRSAVERQLEILGEACQRMLNTDPGIRDRIPETVFAVALRNRIIHGYDRVENAIVYDTLIKDLPTLAAQLETELARLGPPPAA